MSTSSVSDRSAIDCDARFVAFLIALGTLFVSSSAFGAIHYYFGELSVPQGFDQPLDINFENDDYDDVVLENFVFDDVNYQGLTVPYSPGKVVGFASAGVQYVTALSAGATIDASTLGSSYYGALAYGTEYPEAQFTSVSDAFIGLAFPIGTSLHYAWVRVDVDNSAATLLIKDWAFEDQPGVGILAGDQGTLPIYGDINGDHRVDGADFLAWQRGVPVDYNVFDLWKWQDNYGAGMGLPLRTLIVDVPEPGTLSWVFACALGATSVRSRFLTCLVTAVASEAIDGNCMRSRVPCLFNASLGNFPRQRSR